MDEQMLRLINQVLAGDGAAALVTIIATRGSTPRKAGTKMLVFPQGDVHGTVGGGCIEADIRRSALHAIDAGTSSTHTFSLFDDAAAEEGMACGGVMQVFIQVL
jgi:xanthine/CO dehydrogenase XdhC/CoxF family maturation factor